MIRIGLTGLMASGKSAVGQRFRDHGAEIIDGDALGWEILHRPEVRSAIVESFGPSVVGAQGAIDRARLGRIVFRDSASMVRLDAIVQPVLLERVREILDAHGSGVRVLDAALLTTWRLEPELDGVVEIRAPEVERARRLRLARGFDEIEVWERIRGQVLPPVRGAKRHWIIDNDGDTDLLLRRADAVWDELTALADRRAPGRE